MGTFGPHCEHAQCELLDCRIGAVPTIQYPCSDQEICPICGPRGTHWEQAVPHMTAQLIYHFGTTNAEEVRKSNRVAPGIQAECLRYAELLRDNPPRP